MTPSQSSESGAGPKAAAEYTFREPTVEDGHRMKQLVVDTGVLEPNTTYAYLLLATHFAPNSIVAIRDGELVGFVGSYRPPTHPEAIFVWQVGVRADQRGQGLGKRLLAELVRLPGNRDCTHMEATVAPSNTASTRLFKSFAREHDAACAVDRGFVPDDFGPSSDHEAEDLFRIGPIRRQS